MSVQYRTSVLWDTTIIDAEYINATTAPMALRGLVHRAKKITTGAPTAVAGVYAVGAEVVNLISGVHYINTGSTASPAWSTVDVT